MVKKIIHSCIFFLVFLIVVITSGKLSPQAQAVIDGGGGGCSGQSCTLTCGSYFCGVSDPVTGGCLIWQPQCTTTCVPISCGGGNPPPDGNGGNPPPDGGGGGFCGDLICQSPFEGVECPVDCGSGGPGTPPPT